MFWLFRKEGSSQQVSQHELLAAGPMPASNSPASGAVTADVPTPSEPGVEQRPLPVMTPQSVSPAPPIGSPVVAAIPESPVHDAFAPASVSGIDSSDGEVDFAPEHDVDDADGLSNFDAASADESDGSWLDDLPAHRHPGANLRARARGKRLERPVPAAQRKKSHTPQQRLLLLDSWRRSGLPAGDFASLVGISKHTLYKWNKQFEQLGPEGLMDQSRGARTGGRLPDLTKRTILMLKESHPEWGCERISDMLLRGPALAASPSSVARVLHEAGYQMVVEPTRAHPDKVRRFERAKPNQLWQTDLFTFMLKRQNRRVYLVAFMDDHSRFIVSYGLHTKQSQYQ